MDFSCQLLQCQKRANASNVSLIPHSPLHIVPIIWTHRKLNEEENRMRGVNSSTSKEHELEECGKCGFES